MKLRTKEYQVWVKVTHPASGETAEILVSPLTNSQTQNMLAKYRKRMTGTRNQQMVDIDFGGFKREKTLTVIKDWKGPVDEKGKPLPCSDENKLLVLEYDTDFIDAILEKADNLGEFIAETVKEERENL